MTSTIHTHTHLNIVLIPASLQYLFKNTQRRDEHWITSKQYLALSSLVFKERNWWADSRVQKVKGEILKKWRKKEKWNDIKQGKTNRVVKWWVKDRNGYLSNKDRKVARREEEGGQHIGKQKKERITREGESEKLGKMSEMCEWKMVEKGIRMGDQIDKWA